MESNLFSEPLNLECFENFFIHVLESENFKPHVDKLVGELSLLQNHERVECGIEKLKRMKAWTQNRIRAIEERKKLQQKKQEILREENERNEAFKTKTNEEVASLINVDNLYSDDSFPFYEELNILQQLDMKSYENAVKRRNILDFLFH
uniref:Uncharacterized protein n=1 Tax=Panagrolaimus sp. JU765 TaxID=591449 RepID=A0AC34Q5C4_9BILA